MRPPDRSWIGVGCRRAQGEAARPCWATVQRSSPNSATAGCPSGSGCASWSTSRDGRRARTRSTGAASTRRRRSTRRAVVVESDLRAAALAEARFGSGAGVSPFLFAIVGTGASACLVVDGRPYAGGRGEAVVLGAPPVEAVASGTALARAAGLERAEDVLADPALAPLVDAAATALGGALAVLANALDPSLVVLGGGLGAQRGFSERVERVCQSLLAYPARLPRFPSSAPRSPRTAAWSGPLSAALGDGEYG